LEFVMRSMWKGSVAFGLVNVPIKLYAATEDHDVKFHQVHAADGGRIKMQRTCSIDGAPVDYKDLAKAYETDTGQVVLMEDSDFDGLPVPGMREIEVVEFVPSEQVDPVLLDRSYYLEPEPAALKPYVLLREALTATERTAIVKVVLRSKTQMGALRVRDDVLVLQTMLWPDEVRAAEFEVLDAEVELRPQELSMAASLVDSLAADFDPSAFRDEYREALLAVIDAKVAGGQGIAPAASTTAAVDGDGVVLDLMAALRESVARSQADQAAPAAEPTQAEQAAPTAKPRRTTATAKAPNAGGSTSSAKAPAKKAAADRPTKTATAAKKAAKTPETAAKARRRSA
jgi:DNA end-binding protein Ku